MVSQAPDGTVKFHFYRPEVHHVTLAGDFNGWQHCFLMTKRADGWWQCSLRLAPGFYQFRYCADGQWYTDYAAFGVELGPYGWNSVVKVDPPPEAKAEERQAA